MNRRRTAAAVSVAWAAAAPACAVAAVLVLGAVPAAAQSWGSAQARPTWGDWMPIPDHYQGAIDVRFRAEQSKSGPVIRYALRNRYPQRVTLHYQIDGEGSDGLQVIDLTQTLQAAGGGGKAWDQGKGQVVELPKVSRLVVISAEFEGQAPTPTAAGGHSDSSETRRIRVEIARVQEELKRANDEKNVQAKDYITVRSRVEAHRAFSRDDVGTLYILDSRDVAVQQSAMQIADDRMKKLGVRLAQLTTELRAMEKLDAGEMRLVEDARTAFQNGDWAKAETAYRAALADPGVTGFSEEDRAALDANLALALRKQNKLADAETFFRKATELAPQDASYRGNLGATLLAEEKYPEAAAAFAEAADIKPGEVSFHHNRGVALQKQAKYAEAEAAFREAVKVQPSDAESLHALGVSLYQQDKLADAVPVLQSATKRAPTNGTYRLSLGVALCQAERWKEAETALREAYQLGAAPSAYGKDCLGVSLYRQGKVAESVAPFQEAVRLDPSMADYKAHLEAAQSGKPGK